MRAFRWHGAEFFARWQFDAQTSDVRKRGSEAQAAGHAEQALVMGPQGGASGQADGSEKVSVDIAYAQCEEGIVKNETENLFLSRNACLRKVLEVSEHYIALVQMAQCDFTNDEGMSQHCSLIEQGREDVIALTQMIHPDRSVDQDHAGCGRRRGGTVSFGSLPPNRANRRALSRSIRALSASRTRADFSVRPV